MALTPARVEVYKVREVRKVTVQQKQIKHVRFSNEKIRFESKNPEMSIEQIKYKVMEELANVLKARRIHISTIEESYTHQSHKPKLDANNNIKNNNNNYK
ncbi:hypothetical protein CHUAL_013450 [Chamberlinius hualienensis]